MKQSTFENELMNITIFHQNRKVILTDDINFLQTISDCASYQLDDLSLFSFFELVALDESDSLVIINNDLDALFGAVKKEFAVWQAGGGVVFNKKEALLVINRLGKWDLPKGKLEKGELIEECALREVEEETGVSQLFLIDKCCTTYHTYLLKNQWILKETFWFFMRTTADEELIPQKEEAIESVIWAAKSDLGAYLDNTYENIKIVLQQALLFQN